MNRDKTPEVSDAPGNQRQSRSRERDWNKRHARNGRSPSRSRVIEQTRRVLDTPPREGQRQSRSRSRDLDEWNRRSRARRSRSRCSRGRPSRITSRSRSPILAMKRNLQPNITQAEVHNEPPHSIRDQVPKDRTPMRRSRSPRGHAPDREVDVRQASQPRRSPSRSDQRHRSSRRKSRESSYMMINAFKDFIEAMRSGNKSDSSERFPVMNVIPEFDPSKRSQTIEMWIAKVNECSLIYGWTERQTIHYALPKLVGLAQRWYQGLPSVLFSWPEWQIKLKTAFPSEENYGLLLTEMLEKRGKFGESLEEYFYEKMILLNRCRISGKDAVDCILLGIDDRSIRTSAEAVQFTDPDKLLVFLRNVKSTKRGDRNLRPNTNISDSFKRNNINSKGSKTETKWSVKCFNCGEEGHPFFKCQKPQKRCENCSKLGHKSSECFLKQKEPNKSTEDNSKTKSVL